MAENGRKMKEDVHMIFKTLLTHPLFQRIPSSINDGQNNTHHSHRKGNILKHLQGSSTRFLSTRILWGIKTYRAIVHFFLKNTSPHKGKTTVQGARHKATCLLALSLPALTKSSAGLVEERDSSLHGKNANTNCTIDFFLHILNSWGSYGHFM